LVLNELYFQFEKCIKVGTPKEIGKSKGKFVPVLNEVQRHKDISCLIKHHIKMYGGVKVQIHAAAALPPR